MVARAGERVNISGKKGEDGIVKVHGGLRWK
jgi:hypothetical protein